LAKLVYFVNANFVENCACTGKDQSGIDFEQENMYMGRSYCFLESSIAK